MKKRKISAHKYVQTIKYIRQSNKTAPKYDVNWGLWLHMKRKLQPFRIHMKTRAVKIILKNFNVMHSPSRELMDLAYWYWVAKIDKK